MTEDVHDTLKQRQNTHGDFSDNAQIMQTLKDYFRDQEGWKALSPVQREVLDMFALKIGRILSGDPDEPDHWHDLAGYATLAEYRVRP